ncbi:MAG: 3-oxoacyl-[acyl-carrier-protein] synthase III C-terminal domain-containing protein [Caldilineaceae bacterium]
MRIIQNSVVKHIELGEDKVFVNVQRYGNTSTASIPIALCEAIEEVPGRPATTWFSWASARGLLGRAQ